MEGYWAATTSSRFLGVSVPSLKIDNHHPKHECETDRVRHAKSAKSADDLHRCGVGDHDGGD
jgi:hypothetical protein